MLIEPTMEALKEMKLYGMADAWTEQQRKPEYASLGFDERYCMIVDAEKMFRLNRKVSRNLDEAKLKHTRACIEDIDYSDKRGLDKAIVMQLASCGWVHEHQSIVITGPTGVGKTFVACALAQQAVRKGYRALYRRSTRLFDELLQARADGSYPRLLKKLAKIDVLVLDDWGMHRIDETQRRDMMEVLDDRYAERSTILTSQLPTSKWHDHLGDPTTADAICERILHRSHKLTLKGASRRKEEIGG